MLTSFQEVVVILLVKLLLPASPPTRFLPFSKCLPSSALKAAPATAPHCCYKLLLQAPVMSPRRAGRSWRMLKNPFLDFPTPHFSNSYPSLALLRSLLPTGPFSEGLPPPLGAGAISHRRSAMST